MLITRNCLYCKKEFIRSISPDNLKRGKGKYCSHLCSEKHYAILYKEGKIKSDLEGLKLGRYKGWKHSEEAKEKVSTSLRGKVGKLSRNWGNKHSKKTKEIIAQKAKIQSKQQWKDPVFREKYGRKFSKSICPICKKEFQFPISKPKIYCSPKCAYIKPSYNKGKKMPQNSGEKNYRWKGGITPINRKIRTSLEYRIWREQIFERDDYTCQICNKKGGNLRANHIKRFADYPELRLDINNGIVICEKCDLSLVLYHEPEWESYFIFNLKTRGFIEDEHIPQFVNL